MIRDGRPLLVTDPRTARPIRVNYNVYRPEMWISPSGRSVVVTHGVEQIPPSWESYEPRNSSLRLKAGSTLSHDSYASQSAEELELIDLSTGDPTTLANAPMAGSLA